MKPHIDFLKSLDACDEAVDWAEQFDDSQTAWDACERADWMVWLMAYTVIGAPWSDARRPFVLAACECARLPLRYVPAHEHRPRIAIECAESWARGEHDDRKRIDEAARAAAAVASWGAMAWYVRVAAPWGARDWLAAFLLAGAEPSTIRACAVIVRRHYPVSPDRMLLNSQEEKGVA